MYKISVIGTGYVGLVSGTCFAQMGNDVTCIDIDTEKIRKLNAGIVPIYEPGLEELIRNNTEKGTLKFCTDFKKAVETSPIILIAVGTPSTELGEADLQNVKNAAEKIGEFLNGYKVIIVKSTVPVGTGRLVEAIIKKESEYRYEFDVVSNPEFLREGSAVYDTFNMDRAVIGTSSEQAADVVDELLSPFNTRVLRTDLETAEMIKYASNAFLATKISFINEMANICERVGADVTLVAKGMGMDNRIGDKFLNAGIGYGGSCFPKDTRALIKIAEKVNYDLKIIKAVEEVNRLQRVKIVDKLENQLKSLQGKTIGILGLAFKPNTDDIREAPSLTIISLLHRRGAIVKAYDPVAISEAAKQLPLEIIFCNRCEEVFREADAVVLLTEWAEFKSLDFIKLKELMGTPEPVFLDGRNFFDVPDLEKKGWKYISIGR